MINHFEYKTMLDSILLYSRPW